MPVAEKSQGRLSLATDRLSYRASPEEVADVRVGVDGAARTAIKAFGRTSTSARVGNGVDQCPRIRMGGRLEQCC